MRKAKTAPAAMPLTDFQETVCNLAADLILRGGMDEDVANLLRATIGHSLHLQWPRFDAFKADHIANDLPEWQQRIARHWPEKKDPQDALPTTVTEMLRANLRGKLEELFVRFLAKSRMHELYLMNAVLENFDGNARGPDITNAESVLAEALMSELSSDDSYLKVPSEHIEAVEDLLEKLTREIEVPPAKASNGPKLLAFTPRQTSPEAPHAS
jgi:hypothetical protein